MKQQRHHRRLAATPACLMRSQEQQLPQMPKLPHLLNQQ
jgi:hypothetical protein